MTLEGKRILLGLSGGVAAYKAPLILRELAKLGADVRVVMTHNAHQFVTATTLEVLSRHRVHTEMFARDEEFPVLHVGLGGWPDLVLLAPATANLMAKMAHGIADDLLTSLLLSTRARIVVAPSMEEHMLDHPATQASARLLAERGCVLLEPDEGELASGASGRGRLPEPAAIVRKLVDLLVRGGDLEGLTLLVTAGPTVEDLDPVRFLSNRSSGKMGYALAQAARERGARVFLVSGPTHLPPPAGVEVRRVRATLQMQRECEALFGQVDAAIMAAAPVDFRPREPATEKIRRAADGLRLELVSTPDIAAGLGARKERQVLVVFALESQADPEPARDKLARKNGDLVVLNSLEDAGAGFEVDTNVVTLIDRQGNAGKLPLMSKAAVAARILDWVAQACRQRGA
ncbi:MAG: bifunctional phosphopantothenoylcysteine decarboxylase/phosphopantothenate--cysteine ligase CoaBC [Candidatus Latescibacterota bacterium]